MEIIPSIITRNFGEVKTKLTRLEGLVNWAELDVCDGLFTPNVTWPITAGAPEDLKQIDGKIKISAHLMIEHPEAMFGDWCAVSDRIIAHYESTDKLEEIIARQNAHCVVGLALELHTPVEKIYQYLHHVKLVQLMSIDRIGFAGEKFDESVFEKIKTLKTNWPDVRIIIDGGIDLEIGKKLAEAGAGGLVVGSQIWQAENLEEAIKNFKSL